MDFQFSEEQQLLADSLGKLIEKDYDFESRQALIKSELGYAPAVFDSIGELGIFGLPLSEAAGGFGMGAVGMIPVMEQIGRGLLLEPIASTLIASRLLDQSGGNESLLGKVISGSCKLAFAHTEPGMRYDWTQVGMSASDNKLNGTKSLVAHAPMADQILVSARTSGKPGDDKGLSLFLVDADASGISQQTLRTVENYRASDVTFKDTPATLVGKINEAGDLIDEAIDFAITLSGGEALGAMNYANEATLEYLQTRKQFGVPIGKFQVLQHRLVDMTICADQCRSMVYLACDAVDKFAAGTIDANERRRLVSAAKIKMADACRQVGQEAIQLHGGMGMTDEMKISHTFKRLTMIGQLWGDADHHLARFACTDR